MILFPFFNPTHFIARFVIRQLVIRLALPNNIYLMFSSLYSLSNLLVSSAGFIPTIRVLNSIRSIIINYNGRVSLTRLHTLFRSLDTASLNPFVLQNIRTAVFTSIRECLKYSRPVNSFFFMILSSVLFSSFKYMLSSILKIGMSIILFSLTIFWNDSLSSFILLKSFSNFIINNLENLFSFNLPRTGINAADNIPSLNKEVNIDPNSFSYYPSIFALIFLGTIGILGGIVFLDHTHPELLSNIPVIHTISESITSGFNYIYNTISNRFYPTNNIQHAPTEIDPELRTAPNRIWQEFFRIFNTPRSASTDIAGTSTPNLEPNLPSPTTSGSATPMPGSPVTPTPGSPSHYSQYFTEVPIEDISQD